MESRRRMKTVDVDFASLLVRQETTESDVHELKVAMVNLDKKIDGQFKQLYDKMDARAATPWNAIWAALAFLLSVFVVIGGLVIIPRDQVQTDLKASLRREIELRDRKDERAFAQIDSNRKTLDYLRGFMASNPNFKP